jgi:hypothetical protein
MTKLMSFWQSKRIFDFGSQCDQGNCDPSQNCEIKRQKKEKRKTESFNILSPNRVSDFFPEPVFLMNIMFYGAIENGDVMFSMKKACRKVVA